MDLGIIGGSDGPTAILVSGGPAVPIILLLFAVGLAGAAVWLFHHKRKK